MKNLPLRLLELAVVVAMVLLIWSNVMLRRENAGLRIALEQSRRMASSRVFHPGERFEFGGLVSPNGTVMTPSQAPRGRQLVLVVDPNCGTCEEAAGELRALPLSKAVPPVIVSTGNEAETAAFAKRLDVAGLVFRTPESLAPEVRTKYSKTPQVFLVNGGMITTVCGSVGECATRIQSR
ncbi:MAG: hypothetical protein JWO97_3522 [Acidobacteria bacterium]|nr:hypothetical protein [Acidobacteriota bacterium]